MASISEAADVQICPGCLGCVSHMVRAVVLETLSVFVVDRVQVFIGKL